MKRLLVAGVFTAGVVAAADSTPAPAAADSVFATQIQPLLTDHCVGCHGPDKTKGRLRLDSFEHLARGGESGPAVVARDSARSVMVERLLLPVDDEDHMPPRDKPQPAPDVVQLLRWWIDQGADPRVRPADLTIPADLAPHFAPREMLRPRPRAEIEAFLASGALPAVFSIRFVSLESAALHVSSRRATDADVEGLLALRENLTELDLARAPVTDRALATIGRLTALYILRLDGTAITDAGISSLATLHQLVSLNLNATRLTDQALAPLQRLKNLQKIYLWDTAVTPAGVNALHAALFRAAESERLRLQIAALEHARDALRVEIVAPVAAGPEASEAEAPTGMTIADIMKAIHEGKNSKAVLAPQGKLSDDDLNQMLELYNLMAALTPPKGEKAHFQELTGTLIAATKGLLAKTPGADDEYKQAVDCKSCHAQHRAK